jgi:hypothetical protein
VGCVAAGVDVAPAGVFGRVHFAAATIVLPFAAVEDNGVLHLSRYMESANDARRDSVLSSHCWTFSVMARQPQHAVCGFVGAVV